MVRDLKRNTIDNRAMSRKIGPAWLPEPIKPALKESMKNRTIMESFSKEGLSLFLVKKYQKVGIKAARDIIIKTRSNRPKATKLEKQEIMNAKTVKHEIPKDLLGIGIRIEDDIVCTNNGPINLTETAPKTIEEIEAVTA